jgi:hypothetical protein
MLLRYIIVFYCVVRTNSMNPPFAPRFRVADSPRPNELGLADVEDLGEGGFDSAFSVVV